MYRQMEVDYVRHPNNVRQHKASEAAARCWKGLNKGDDGPGQSAVDETMRLVTVLDRAARLESKMKEQPQQQCEVDKANETAVLAALTMLAGEDTKCGVCMQECTREGGRPESKGGNGRISLSDFL